MYWPYQTQSGVDVGNKWPLSCYQLDTSTFSCLCRMSILQQYHNNMAALRTTALLAALCRRATRWSQQVTKLSFSTKVCSQHPFMNLKTMFRNSVFLLLNSQMIISFLLNVILANSSAILKQTRYLGEVNFWLIDQSEKQILNHAFRLVSSLKSTISRQTLYVL